MMRFLYMTGGMISFLCALAGVILPLLPATPFLLLSAFCFARSSDRLHSKLLGHPYFGAMIRNWQTHRGISKSNKIHAMIAILFTIIISICLGISPILLQIQIAMLGLVSIFILTRPQSN